MAGGTVGNAVLLLSEVCLNICSCFVVDTASLQLV